MMNRDLSLLHNSSTSFDPRNVNIRIAAELQLEPTIALEKARKWFEELKIWEWLLEYDCYDYNSNSKGSKTPTCPRYLVTMAAIVSGLDRVISNHIVILIKESKIIVLLIMILVFSFQTNKPWLTNCAIELDALGTKILLMTFMRIALILEN